MQRLVDLSSFVKILHFFVSTELFLLEYFNIKHNIETAARAYGLEDAELFQSVDLFEKRNIPQVTQCLFALGRHVRYFFTS